MFLLFCALRQRPHRGIYPLPMTPLRSQRATTPHPQVGTVAPGANPPHGKSFFQETVPTQGPASKPVSIPQKRKTSLTVVGGVPRVAWVQCDSPLAEQFHNQGPPSGFCGKLGGTPQAPGKLCTPSGRRRWRPSPHAILNSFSLLRKAKTQSKIFFCFPGVARETGPIPCGGNRIL